MDLLYPGKQLVYKHCQVCFSTSWSYFGLGQMSTNRSVVKETRKRSESEHRVSIRTALTLSGAQLIGEYSLILGNKLRIEV